MSKKVADLTSGASRGSAASSGGRGPAARRAATSARLAREARQTRLAYLALVAVVVLIVLTLIAGLAWQYVITPAQTIATVNGTTIRNDTFQRYQKFERYLLQNQANQLQNEIAQLQADTKHAAANQALISQLTQQQQQIQTNAGNVPAYTLQQMEQALEQTRASAQLGATPTPAQLDAEMAKLRQQAGGSVGFARLLSQTGVTEQDLRTYFASVVVVQQNVTNYYANKVAPTQHQAEARHILVKTQALANTLAGEVRHGANFAALAKKYSIDNGLQSTPGFTPTAGQRLQLFKQSSAYNGGWLRDPSVSGPPSKPTWLTPQTSYVAPVLNAILAMKPGEVRVVQSQYGWHVIQVTATRTHKLSKTELQTLRQQQGSQGYQTWFSTATDPTKNKVVPPDPYTQYPATTPGA